MPESRNENRIEADGPVVLSTRALAVGYRDGHRCNVVASGLDLELLRGEVTCLLGGNGVGKSTLLRTLCRRQAPLAGRVEVCGTDMATLSRLQVARLMSVVYTDRTGAGGLTVREVVGLGRQPFTGFFGRLDDEDRMIVDRSLEAVGIVPLADRYMATLSDGERQKAMIARAVAQQAPVMILDEPTSFLDVASRLEVMDLLKKIATDNGTAVLLSTHDVSDALSVSDRLWLMNPERQLIAGPTEAIIGSGAMDTLFAGRNIVFDAASGNYRIADRDSKHSK